MKVSYKLRGKNSSYTKRIGRRDNEPKDGARTPYLTKLCMESNTFHLKLYMHGNPESKPSQVSRFIYKLSTQGNDHILH